ncbi:hypothetical protein CC1G_11689 [Coprinopsis cinerea okayama7|uniref:DNA polymerase delta catalytic subunit n=1 Tax=Coprinopsis cinerea (strain Okayama-7 / 130 / ATCC MYA-4618 / FGSC 9003) TaxID=240176 RepID=A8NRH3_COPC7|nr:hypothetical protein CC1G_11689 [Coprinopsis cinerea okayama7\|eukprot:XP_001835784.1 hypothetical protein CC1G_11689 [Coprinopsis cinerea okayama7\
MASTVEFATALADMGPNSRVMRTETGAFRSSSPDGSLVRTKDPLLDPLGRIVFRLLTSTAEYQGRGAGAIHLSGLTKDGATIIVHIKDYVPTVSSGLDSHSYLGGFIRERNIQVMCWMALSQPGHVVQDPDNSCSLDVNVSYQYLVPLPPDDPCMKSLLPNVVPLRILSFDIETMVIPRNPRFPKGALEPINPSNHAAPVLQISNVISSRYGHDNTAGHPFMRVIFVLGECDPIQGAQAIPFRTEGEMLEAWRSFVLSVDPDVITGYNISRFDLPYLLVRAGICRLNTFKFLGRLSHIPSVTTTDVQSWNRNPVTVAGRLTFDLWDHISRRKDQLGLFSMKLGNVAHHFLREDKVDLDIADIPQLQEGGPATRRKLAIYCLKDAYLVQRLLDHLNAFEDDLEAARARSIPVERLMSRGTRY